MFTSQELQALLAFLQRVTLNGNEAETLVYLKQKITKELETPPKTAKQEQAKSPAK